MVQKLVDELYNRKVGLVAFLTNLYLIATLLGVVLNVGLYFRIQDQTDLIYRTIQTGVNLVLLAFFIFVKFYLIKRHLQLSFIILATLPLGVASWLMLLAGIGTIVPYLIFVIVLLSSSIVLGLKRTFIMLAGIIFLIISITVLHLTNMVDYEPADTDSTWVLATMAIVLLILLINILRLGYSQIEYSYKKAYEYSKELEALNKELDERVKIRTEQLKTSYDNQVETLYSAATMGGIARSLLHDISTPLSTIAGGLSMMEAEADPDNKELMDISRQAVDQMRRMVKNSQDLMRNQNPLQSFSPSEIVENNLIIVNNLLNENDIQTEVDISDAISIVGPLGIFERIVLNLVINAVEALNQTDKQGKLIKITGKMIDDQKFQLRVRDNGTGIEDEILDKIFLPDFSIKKDGRHLGIGLYFVSNSIEKYYKGSIEVDTEPNNYTEFTLIFTSNEQPQEN